MRTAGIILDVYDDPQGRVLREKLDGAALPEKLASAQLLDAEDLARIPDRLFGLVAHNNGETIRKYAMHDEAHLVTSMIYFAETSKLIPEEARQKVAANLVNACAWYDIDPPDLLVKEALGVMNLAVGGLEAANMVSATREASEKRRQTQDAFRRAQASGAKVAAGNVIELSTGEDASIQASAPQATDTTPGHVDKVLARRDQHGSTTKKLHKQLNQKEEQTQPSETGEKVADLTGTELMPRGIRTKSVRSEAGGKMALPVKTSSWQHAGNLTGREPVAKTKQASPQRFALPERGLYPLDTAVNVKQAEAYFEQHHHAFPPADRRAFAQSTWERAQELGLKVAGRLLDYAGSDYGPYIHSELVARARGFEGTGHSAIYEALAEKRASMPPSAMAELLSEADAKTGAAQTYGRPGVGLLDPYAAVYGSAKVAAEQPTKEESFSWVDGSDYVNGFMLTALAESGAKLDETFGEGFEKSFRKDPIGIFQSMPDPQKVVLSRMASDNSSTPTP